MWNVWFVFLHRDIDKYGHADIDKHGDVSVHCLSEQ